jgi:hypothetical protein
MAGRPGGYRRPLFRGRGDRKSTNLADRTHITQPSPILKIYRDSEGRTRTEHSLLAPAANGQPGRTEAPSVIRIIDPVANVMYTLTSTDKVARQLNLQAPESVRASQPGVPGGSSASLTLARRPSRPMRPRRQRFPKRRTKSWEAKPLTACRSKAPGVRPHGRSGPGATTGRLRRLHAEVNRYRPRRTGPKPVPAARRSHRRYAGH